MQTSAVSSPRLAPAAPAPSAAAPTPAAEVPEWLRPDVVARRTAAGRIAEYTSPSSLIPADGVAPAYFRSYNKLKSAMTDLAAKYPNLVELTDIGDSGDKTRGTADRDILALKLTNRNANAGKKPGAFYIAGAHAREIANPEMMLRFATQLLAGYGSDPEATAMLDTREITIVPMTNPDGHNVVELGLANQPGGRTMQRKNTTPPAGTDLNRNFDFHWGGPGASSSPSSDIYRGAKAASEPETRAVQDAVLASKPGIFIDWHSYSRLNLYPWGDTEQPAPDDAGLSALANKFSTWNHYTPEKGIDLYPTSGTSNDWVYGKTKAPAFVIETGDSFLQTDKEFEESWALNSPIMAYAAKVADAPYDRVKGPDTLDVLVAKSPGPDAGILNAQVAAGAKGAIRAAEWTVDPFSAPGSGTPLTAADGAFNGATELVTGNVPLNAGKLVYVRAEDAKGNWGPTTAQWLKTPAIKQ